MTSFPGNYLKSRITKKSSFEAFLVQLYSWLYEFSLGWDEKVFTLRGGRKDCVLCAMLERTRTRTRGRRTPAIKKYSQQQQQKKERNESQEIQWTVTTAPVSPSFAAAARIPRFVAGAEAPAAAAEHAFICPTSHRSRLVSYGIG